MIKSTNAWLVMLLLAAAPATLAASGCGGTTGKTRRTNSKSGSTLRSRPELRSKPAQSNNLKRDYEPCASAAPKGVATAKISV